jgi:hypothetical protein
MRKNKVYKNNNSNLPNKSNPNLPIKTGPTLFESVSHGIFSGFGAGVGIEGARSIFSGSSKDQTSEIDKCKFEKEQLEKCMNSGMDCKDYINLLISCNKSN